MIVLIFVLLCVLKNETQSGKLMLITCAFATAHQSPMYPLHKTDSVLCGSKKYPSRDPFAHLLKGSLQTFLNAMTYPDRTVYPVSLSYWLMSLLSY